MTFPLQHRRAPRAGRHHPGAQPAGAVLAALHSCTAIVAQRVAQEMGIALRGLDLHAGVALDPQCIMGQAEVKPYFLEVRQRLGVDAEATEAQLDELREAVARRCPAFDRIRDAGVHVGVERRRA